MSMSDSGRQKRRPVAKTTPQPTPSFDPVNPETKKRIKVTRATEKKLQGRKKSRGGRKVSASQK